MKLLLDANISYRLVKALSNHYQGIAHVTSYFPHNSSDLTIWEFALKEGFVIVTNDEDFVSLLATKNWPPKVILLKTGNQSNDFLSKILISKQFDIERFYDNGQQGMLVIQ